MASPAFWAWGPFLEAGAVYIRPRRHRAVDRKDRRQKAQGPVVTIDFGNWAGADLRTISELVSVKETYDKYYPWASSYSHAMWGAVRESSYRICANPLHRLHRYPEEQALGDCLYDAVILVDEILGLVDAEYPSFTPRLMESN